jgi:hypothetical protein
MSENSKIEKIADIVHGTIPDGSDFYSKIIQTPLYRILPIQEAGQIPFSLLKMAVRIRSAPLLIRVWKIYSGMNRTPNRVCVLPGRKKLKTPDSHAPSMTNINLTICMIRLSG